MGVGCGTLTGGDCGGCVGVVGDGTFTAGGWVGSVGDGCGCGCGSAGCVGVGVGTGCSGSTSRYGQVRERVVACLRQYSPVVFTISTLRS